MLGLSEKGVIHLLALILLLLGLAAGVYLTTSGNPLKLFSRATNPPIVFKNADGGNLPTSSSGVPQTATRTIKIELTSPLGGPVFETPTPTSTATPSPTDPPSTPTPTDTPTPTTTPTVTTTPTPPTSCQNLGDVNLDGSVTGQDADLILRVVVGSENITSEQQRRADTDGNGQITSVDALLIRRVAEGIDQTFRICSPVLGETTQAQTSGTTSYKVAEDPAELDSIDYSDYTEHPMVIDFTLSPEPENKFIWVEFKDVAGRTERRSAQIKLVNQSSIITIDPIIVDSEAIYYSTFTSHNQKVVSNQYGYFITYLHHDTSCPTNNYNVCNDINIWRLARSTDGGRTFTTIYEETNNTRAPVIETDLQGNIYLMRSHNMTGQNQPTEFYKFSANSLNSQSQTITPEIKTPISTLPTKSGKYAMEINNSRREIYYFTLPGWFAVLNFDGTIKTGATLLTRDGPAGMHYPYLYLDERGVLYAAWTTVRGNAYRSIHFIKSEDGGVNWKKAGGGSLGDLPIIADETGPADMISLPEEYEMGPFLTTFTVNYEGDTPLAHFMYVAQDNQHYTRFNLSENAIDTNIYSHFTGETISVGFDSGLCVHKNGTTKIYCVNKLRGQNGIGVLRSDDNGTTWHDHAKTEVTDYKIYAIGGSPQLTNDGYIIGTYTDGLDFCLRDIDPCPTPKRVRFFKVSTQ